nr:hypothetical protein asmbl_5 [uncultured bacterium]
MQTVLVADPDPVDLHGGDPAACVPGGAADLLHELVGVQLVRGGDPAQQGTARKAGGVGADAVVQGGHRRVDQVPGLRAQPDEAGQRADPVRRPPAVGGARLQRRVALGGRVAVGQDVVVGQHEQPVGPGPPHEPAERSGRHVRVADRQPRTQRPHPPAQLVGVGGGQRVDRSDHAHVDLLPGGVVQTGQHHVGVGLVDHADRQVHLVPPHGAEAQGHPAPGRRPDGADVRGARPHLGQPPGEPCLEFSGGVGQHGVPPVRVRGRGGVGSTPTVGRGTDRSDASDLRDTSGGHRGQAGVSDATVAAERSRPVTASASGSPPGLPLVPRWPGTGATDRPA